MSLCDNLFVVSGSRPSPGMHSKMGSLFLMLRGFCCLMIYYICTPTLKKAKICKINFTGTGGGANFDQTNCYASVAYDAGPCMPKCATGYEEAVQITAMTCGDDGSAVDQAGTCTGKARNKRGRGELLISIDNLCVAFIFF